VVILAAAFIARLPPAANVAVLDRIGVGVICRRPGHGCQQRALYLPEIGSVVSKPVLLRLEFRPGRDDIHVFGREVLRLGQKVGIETELQDRPRFRFASEFRIDRFIRPTAQRARHLDPAQNVGTSVPALIRQCGLRDHRHTALHGRERLDDRLIRNLNPVDPDDVQAHLRQVLDIAPLMGGTAFRQDLQKRIPDLRFRQSAFGHRAVQAREVTTVQVTDQVGRAEREGIPHLLHKIEGYSAKLSWQRIAAGQLLKVFFREFAKRVGDGRGKAQRDGPISDGLPPEAVANHLHGTVGRPTRHPSLGTGPALFVLEPEWELELHVPALLEVRHRDRAELHPSRASVVLPRRGIVFDGNR
jgi:hypothetical protein